MSTQVLQKPSIVTSGQHLAITASLGSAQLDQLKNIYRHITAATNLAAPLLSTTRVHLLDVHVDEGFAFTFENWIQRWLHPWQSFTLRFHNFSGKPPHQVYLRGMWYNYSKQMNALSRLALDVAPFSITEVEVNTRLELPLFVNLPGILFDSIMNVCARMQFTMDVEVTQLELIDVAGQKTLAIFPIQRSC